MKTLLACALTAALAIGAGAASAQSSAANARVSFGDLDLSTPAGVATLDARIAAGARALCRTAQTGSRISGGAQCTAAFRAEVLAQMPSEARAQYAAASRRAVTL